MFCNKVTGAVGALVILLSVSSGAAGRSARLRPAGQLRTGWRQPVRAVAFDPAGRWVAAGGDDAEIVVYDVAKQRSMLRLSTRGAVMALAASPDGKHLAVGIQSRTVQIVEIASGRVVRRLGPLTGWPRSISYSPTAPLLAVAGQSQQVALFDLRSGRRVRRLFGPVSWVNQVAFSDDGTHLAAAGWDHAVRVWVVASGALVSSGFGHRFAVDAVAFSPDGRRVLSASDDQTLRIFSVSRGTPLRRVPGPAITCLARARGADVILAGTYRGRLLVLSQTQLYTRLVVRAHRGEVYAVAITRDGRLGVSGGRDGQVRLWRVRGAK